MRPELMLLARRVFLSGIAAKWELAVPHKRRNTDGSSVDTCAVRRAHRGKWDLWP